MEAMTRIERSEVPSFLLPGRTEMVSPLYFFERLRHSLSLRTQK